MISKFTSKISRMSWLVIEFILTAVISVSNYLVFRSFGWMMTIHLSMVYLLLHRMYDIEKIEDLEDRFKKVEEESKQTWRDMMSYRKYGRN